jgi:hypothetical protein
MLPYTSPRPLIDYETNSMMNFNFASLALSIPIEGQSTILEYPKQSVTAGDLIIDIDLLAPGTLCITGFIGCNHVHSNDDGDRCWLIQVGKVSPKIGIWAVHSVYRNRETIATCLLKRSSMGTLPHR